jgi:hypothetical protein
MGFGGIKLWYLAFAAYRCGAGPLKQTSLLYVFVAFTIGTAVLSLKV